MKPAIQFLVAIVFLLILDSLWLGFIMKKFYHTELGTLMRTVDGQFKPILWAAGMVYFAIALGIVVFVLPRATDLAQSFIYGACLGFIIYGVYDFTNLATIQNWSLKLTIVDVAWGAFLCGTTSLLVTLVNNKFAS